MEPNYIKTSQSAIKSKMMEKALEESPIDRKKAIHGEQDQANYLIEAKEQNSPYLKKKISKYNENQGPENSPPDGT